MNDFQPTDVELLAYARVRQRFLTQPREVQRIVDDLIKNLDLRRHGGGLDTVAETLRECLNPL